MKVKCIDDSLWHLYLKIGEIYDVERKYTNKNGVELYELKGVSQHFKVERFEVISA
ncbi:TPA: hypothetical protein N2D99_002275 [Clostridium botulinum]|nr:hypothetical protein [Clostridium botulinum]